jgi:hypothetical protein
VSSSRGYIVYGAVDGEEEGEFGVAAVVLFEVGVSELLRSALELISYFSSCIAVCVLNSQKDRGLEEAIDT